MSLTHTAHTLITDAYPEIDCAIDATCGNGHDTLFLTKLCSEQGQVFSFDIQQQAIDSTLQRLEENKLVEKANLICASHETMQRHIKQKAQVIMFNLGYLPSADKNITTQAPSTINALNNACQLLAHNGLLSILCYPGHAEGKIETEQVKQWLDRLDKQRFTIEKHQSTVATDTSPLLFIICSN